jgi:hypothetical protein
LKQVYSIAKAFDLSMKNGCLKYQLLLSFILLHYDLLDSLNYDYLNLKSMMYSTMLKQKSTKVFDLVVETILNLLGFSFVQTSL